MVAQDALLSWKPMGPRLITACFRTQQERIKLNVTQCYAPTNKACDEDKEEFYGRLQDLLSDMNEQDDTFLMGDLNAKIGEDN